MELELIKQRNKAYLDSIGIITNASLPTIEELIEVKPQGAESIAKRICALSYVIGLAYGADPKQLRDYLKSYGLWESVTYREKRLLEAELISTKEQNEIRWMVESMQALAWSLGIVELDNLKNCDDDLADNFPIKSDPSEFIKEASRVSIYDIQKNCDLLYQMHWACNHDNSQNQLDKGVICARRSALDWVYGVDPEWEDIPMDT
ncbi:hypothetical protein N474_17370 [Pseudoalteromonas luteoviolacea CPMOR-2]|uniref:DUF4272 domain-containing protein n=1 Tax=Pseudoalteromonas luteoviolacea DSM 6061 TaxID=1365250 RepID=A0A161ZWL8_9GAMM|nr:DUF4272 domain-containing protein [Pseudoalteromonas luteoviolacea]KZN36699.1 hypothetical protein N475_17385 [Pseudoalteromonas luteoviolacea DSM 6061]KZN54802.1 hypothetical protein N474_17370 [Pseudoalteromonas luteoviolacea CPMOR-2]MBE0390140.1 hypothetical protein [Pseudoalteromonas luteoviolacea DSM 6061]